MIPKKKERISYCRGRLFALKLELNKRQPFYDKKVRQHHMLPHHESANALYGCANSLFFHPKNQKEKSIFLKFFNFFASASKISHCLIVLNLWGFMGPYHFLDGRDKQYSITVRVLKCTSLQNLFYVLL